MPKPLRSFSLTHAFSFSLPFHAGRRHVFDFLEPVLEICAGDVQ